jgi:hypothetical protein
MLKLQLSFQLWTSQMQETLNLKKHGDTAFRAKDFVTAIDCYTKVRGFQDSIWINSLIKRLYHKRL